MKIKKTITDKVIAANRQNAQHSPGPKNAEAVKNNAFKHGLLGKCIKFRDEDEEKHFNQLLQNIEQDFQHAIQHMLHREIATCWWKSQMADRDLRNADRQNASALLLRKLIPQLNNEDRNISSVLQRSDNPEQIDLSGWEGRELVLKTGNCSDDGPILPGKWDDETGRSVVELRLSSSMERTMRYQATLKRDFYRALHTLMDLQRERSTDYGSEKKPKG